MDEDSALRRKAGTDRPAAISSLTLQEKLDRLYVEDRTNKRENLAAEDGVCFVVNLNVLEDLILASSFTLHIHDRRYVLESWRPFITRLLFQIENATFGSITIRYIDELDTVDEDGVAALSRPAREPVQSIPNTSQEEESFPGF